MKIEEIDFELLISKKENAETYKNGIDDLQKEINDLKSKIDLSMISEEKNILNKEIEQKNIELETLKVSYQEKRENIEYEINNAKQGILEYIEETENKLISKEEHDKLNEEKTNKEAELLECEKDIKEVKEELKSLIDKDNGYEQDAVTLSKKLDNLTAYKTYIKEEIEEINGKLTDKFIIEENLEEIKYIKGMKSRLADLSYDTIENWVEKEQEFYSEINEENELSEVEPIEVEPTKVDPIKVDPTKAEPTKVEPIKADTTKVEPTGKIEKRKDGEPSREGKVENKVKVVPGIPQPEYETHKVKDPVLEKYESEGFGKNAFGWYFNPWIDEYDENYDPHNDKEYNDALKENKKDTTEKKENSEMNNEKENIDPKEPEIKKSKSEDNEEKQSSIKDSKSKTKPEENEFDNKNIDRKTDKSKNQVKRIIINPFEESISSIFNNEEMNKIGWKREDIVSLNYEKKQIDDMKKVIKNFSSIKEIDEVSNALDPNVLKWLISNRHDIDIELEDYLKLLSGENTGFEIIYDLSNIYDSDLDYKQIKNLNKIAKSAEKQSNGNVIVDKPNIIQKIFGNIRKIKKVRNPKLLLSEKNTNNEQQKENKEKYLPKHSKPRTRIVDKLKARLPKREKSERTEKRPNIISKTKSMAVSLGKDSINELEIAGARLIGFFKNESKAERDLKARSMRNNSFIPKAKVDEKAAIEKVNDSKESQEKGYDIIIE